MNKGIIYANVSPRQLSAGIILKQPKTTEASKLAACTEAHRLAAAQARGLQAFCGSVGMGCGSYHDHEKGRQSSPLLA